MKYLLIYTNHRQEVIAHQDIQSKGYSSYLPMVYKDKKVNKNTGVEPMFPRYLFVGFVEGEDDMHTIKKAHGVSNVVHFGGEPAYAPNALIESIKAKEDENGLIDVWKDYESGEEIRIKSGIFKDYEGRFLHRKTDERVAILLAETSRIIELPKKDIEPKIA